ncbi:MAG TPA: glycosyltransferase family 2 protein [Verrucomicrobiae bacterium]
MNVPGPKKIVVLGFLSHFPVAGVAWQTVHYLVGLRKLGFEVYYVEAHGCTPGKLMQSETDDGPARAAAYISGILEQFDFGGHWAYHALYEQRYFGLTESQLKELYASAELIINLHGSHLPNSELAAGGRLAYVETDPVDVEIDLFHKKKETLEYLAPHCAFFTYGENLGKPDCLVPPPLPFKFVPTRQPVVLEFWNNGAERAGELFTTIGNWRQPWREFIFKGETYRWSKHLEFEKFIDLPKRVKQGFELSLSSYTEADRLLLEQHGWRVRHALDISTDLQPYREYITDSRGEFTVAKDQNVRLRSGWFSDRAATYLAAGRPVVTQETAFSNHLPTGEGLFGFSSMEDIVAAIDAINGDYAKHRRAAGDIAREFFSHEVVLGAMLKELGISPQRAAPAAASEPAVTSGDRQDVSSTAAQSATRGLCEALNDLPPDLVLEAVSRWPTRIPGETMKAVESWGVPTVAKPEASTGERASVVILTHNGLHFTKMCVRSLFAAGWQDGDELIVVDNASSDGTPAYLSELSRQNSFVRVVRNAANQGFARANNQGLAIASGAILILLNNDTVVAPGWRNALVRRATEPGIGLVGPVTNRTCNEAQIDAPYRTYREFRQFAGEYTSAHEGQLTDLSMVAMFCVAMRREVFQKVGPLDEQFELGMFEDDDYARRVRLAGYGVGCAEDCFVHHFGQASLGELCTSGTYDRTLEANRRRFEQKWETVWKPHQRRITPQYVQLRERIRQAAATHLPADAAVVVVSKGDNELLNLQGKQTWHFPQLENGEYANYYPAQSGEAIAQLEAARRKGARFLLIPKPSFWWLKYYGGLKEHLERHGRLAVKDEETCVIYDLGGSHG